MKQALGLILVIMYLACGIDYAVNGPQVNLLPADEQVRTQYAKIIFGKKEAKKLARVSNVEQFMHEQIQIGLPEQHKAKAANLTNAIIRESNKNGFDPLFILALIKHESSLNPEALGRHGEIGLMQIKPSTAKYVSKKANIKYDNKQQLLNPEANVRIGVAYLALLHKKFYHAQNSVAAYNMGPNNVKKILAKKSLPKEYFGKVYNHYSDMYADLLVRSLSSTNEPDKTLVVADAD